MLILFQISAYKTSHLTSYLKKNESATQDSQTGKLGITITNHFSYPIITNIEETGAAFGHLKVGDIVLSITNYKNNTTNKYSIVDENMSFSTIFDNGLDLPNKKVTVEVARFDSNNNLLIENVDIVLNEGNEVNYSYIVDEDIDDTLMVKLTSFVAGNNGTGDKRIGSPGYAYNVITVGAVDADQNDNLSYPNRLNQ